MSEKNRENSALNTHDSSLRKRSVKIAGHATSITLEEPFWDALKDLAAAQNLSINQLVSMIDAQRGDANLSSALRVYVLRDLQERN